MACKTVIIQKFKKRVKLLGRVSMLNSKNEVIYDKFVRYTGKNVTEDKIKPKVVIDGYKYKSKGEFFYLVRSEVTKIISDKIVIGHGVGFNLKALKIDNIPLHLVRDTSKYWKFRNVIPYKTPSLDLLNRHFFGKAIIDKQDSIADAKLVLQLYKLVENEWELLIKYRGVLDKNGNRKGLRDLL